MASASIKAKFCRAIKARATADFPEPMPPIKPITGKPVNGFEFTAQNHRKRTTSWKTGEEAWGGLLNQTGIWGTTLKRQSVVTLECCNPFDTKNMTGGEKDWQLILWCPKLSRLSTINPSSSQDFCQDPSDP